MAHAALNELSHLNRAAATLSSVGSLLSWDQETYMPPSAAAHRAEQQALLAGIYHERRTSPRIGSYYLCGHCGFDYSLAASAPHYQLLSCGLPAPVL